jgi:hypothetical protein
MHTRSSAPTPIRGVRGLHGSVAAIAALAIAATLSACGSSTTYSSSTQTKTNLNTPNVERAIERSIRDARHVHAKVVCPKVVPQEKGHNFTCIATIGKTTMPFAVIQQDNGGDVTYRAK